MRFLKKDLDIEEKLRYFNRIPIENLKQEIEEYEDILRFYTLILSKAEDVYDARISRKKIHEINEKKTALNYENIFSTRKQPSEYGANPPLFDQNGTRIDE